MNRYLDLIFPRYCAGCGAWDADLCPYCEGLFGEVFTRVEGRAPYLTELHADETESVPFPVWALAPYAGAVSRTIITWKNVVNAGLSNRMRITWAKALRGLSPEELFPAYRAARGAVVVPAPSARRRKHGGRFVAGEISRQTAKTLRLEAKDVLIQPTRRAFQKVSRQAERRKKAARIRVRGQHLAGRDVVLVDDVLTTGATLAGCRHAIAQAGGRVIGALVIAVAEDPRMSVIEHTSAGKMSIIDSIENVS